MTVRQIARKVGRTYHMNETELLKTSLRDFLINRKSEIERDIIEILSKHDSDSLEELRSLVKAKKEHPVWEDLITVENLYEALTEIKDDIKALS